MSVNQDRVTVRDAIHMGIVLGIGQTQTLAIWRELGGSIRDIEFAEQWRQEVEAFKQWRKLDT